MRYARRIRPGRSASKYIMDQARKLKSGNCAMVKDSIVYEWAEDYYRLDDKALEEKRLWKPRREKRNRKPISRSVWTA